MNSCTLKKLRYLKDKNHFFSYKGSNEYKALCGFLSKFVLKMALSKIKVNSTFLLDIEITECEDFRKLSSM